jgi:threonine 3-dehydrogenase
MSDPVALITGAGGEMGRLLLPALRERGIEVVALDLADAPEDLGSSYREWAKMDLLDEQGVTALIQRHRPTYVFHLAAILSSHAERDYELAHRVNVEGTLQLFRICQRKAEQAVRFLFPSSIAVYGLPTVEEKELQGAVREWQWTTPAGMYGCNKLYCELVGTYLSLRQPQPEKHPIDFRAIRFPGLISAATLPSGGTTDFAPEMIHAAAQHKPYACFVREDSRLPFMTMPDGVEALVQLAETDPSRLSRRIFNIKGFSCSAGEIRQKVLEHYPDAEITFAPLAQKQAIVDSWPADINDSRARRDWGFAPRHGMDEALTDYLIPALRERYVNQEVAKGR